VIYWGAALVCVPLTFFAFACHNSILRQLLLNGNFATPRRRRM